MADNVQRQIIAERLQASATRKKAIREVEKHLGGRTLVTFFTSFDHPVEIESSDCDMLQSALQHIDLSKGLALMIDSPDGATAHGGYYWLAYDPANLLPSCDKCNNKKSDQFPVQAIYVFDPPASQIDIDAQEQPLLIHPCRDDPGQHIRFGVAGAIAAVDEKGQRTIEVFGLDRAELADLRKARQEEACTQFGVALMNRVLHGIPIEMTMERFTGEKAQFSMAVSDYLRSQKESIMTDLQN